MSDSAKVIFYNDVPFIDRGNGVRSRPLVDPDNGATQLLAGITEIPPGQEIPLHTHSSEEFVLVLAGKATVRIDGKEYSVQAMDSTFVHPDVAHQYINTGDETLRILWTYGDVNSTRKILATGETLGHLDPYMQS